ncbi:MAG: DUF4912 domain-containing protein [Acidobacteriia bacterium]|nr:DUF4912 domain-containing protein [Terriglobia bacterium]
MTDESGSEGSQLLGVVRTTLARIISAIRAFGAALPSQAPQPKTGSRPFGDYEKVEEAKYHSAMPPSPADAGDLPEWSGRPRVVLLPVDPYLVHVYWDFDLSKLPEDTSAAVLRFYDADGHFDVGVDLRTSNWYVPLWSPAKTYYADLGAITAAGDFIPLLRSNTIQTPRAWPVAEVEHRFVSASTFSPHSREAVPSLDPPFHSDHAGMLEIANRADGSPTAAQPPPAEAEPAVSVAAPPTQQDIGLSRDTQDTDDVVPVTAPPTRQDTGLSRDTQYTDNAVSVTAPPTRQHAPPGAAEILRRRLSEIYELRQSPPQPPRAVVESPPAAPAIPPLPAVPDLPGDLTAHAERQFSPGLSSLLLGTQGPKGPVG